jgi:arginine utilization regulatory protein
MDEGLGVLGGALFHTVLNSVDEAIHVVNRDGVTVFYNHAAADLDSLDPREVIGKHLLEVYPSLSAETSTLLTVLRTGKPLLNQQQTYVTKKGTVVTTISSTLPLLAGSEVVGSVEMSKNVTRIKELSEKLINLQLELSERRAGPRKVGGQSALYTFDDIVGRDPKTLLVKEMGMRAARSNSTVLVYGDTGTGKELLVQAIHNAGRRCAAPFIAQNCAALPETLVEGLLFGTAKGAFTGAEDRPGLFELADGGTLYLDEINSLAPDLQAKLLRVLQDGRVRRVGDTRVRHVDVRVIASMNVRPEEALAGRKLRADLYYRLNVVYIEIPPLRERPDDIPVLVQHFIRKCNDKLGSSIVGVTPEVFEMFLGYDWPGNVRELEHCIEGAAVVVGEGFIRPGDLPPHLGRSAARGIPGRLTIALDPATPLRKVLMETEARMIRSAVEQSRGNVSRAARTLGIPRQTLQRKLKALRP